MTKLDPYHFVLYSSMQRNSLQPASEINRLNCLLLAIPFTFKSSNTIIDLVFAKLVVVLCKKSLRMFRFFLCRRASLSADFFRLLDPITLRLCCRDAFFKRCKLLANGFGEII